MATSFSPEHRRRGLFPVWRAFGLRTRVSLSYALGALLLSTGMAVSTFVLAQQRLLADTENLAVSQMFNNAERLRNGLQNLPDSTTVDAEAVDPVSNILEELPRANNARVLLILADNQPRSLSGLVEQNIPTDLRQLIIRGEAASKRFETPDGAQFASGVRIAEINADYYEILPLTATEATLATLRRILIGASAVATILGAGMGYYFARRILQPITRAAEAAEAISGGDFDTRLDPPSDPDLAKLSASFNDMVGALKARIERDERFASDVSHELRSPLMTLAASVDVLEHRRPELPEAAQRATDLLSKDIQRFQRLVEDLLEISRLDAGAIQLDTDVFNVVEFLERVVAQSRVPTIQVIAEDDNPFLVDADKRRLHQVIANLLDNARKYAGGATEIHVSRHNDRLRIAVIDEGPGVAPADRLRIFDRFSRAGSDAGRRDVAKGVGLGLSLVAEHVRLHGGRIWVDGSTPTGTGARFVLELPGVSPDYAIAFEELAI
ncbi:MAG: HAMP domain-containing histidine kinase [Acidimicrobiales bacterium]|nr:HAMP domain-containing histidine kinase [Acidimicrobiales bacterium]